MNIKTAKLLTRFISFISVSGILGCNPQSTEWPPWQIEGESTLLTSIDLPINADEVNSLGRLFYDLDREQVYIEVPAWELLPENIVPRVGRKLRTDYFYIDTAKNSLENTVKNIDAIDLFKNSSVLYVSDAVKRSEIYKQPFGNLEIKSSINKTFSFPVLVTNFPPPEPAHP